MSMFQDFYSYTGRLPNFSELLIVPDGDVPPQEKINLKNLYDLFKNTSSPGAVSVPLGRLFHYFHQESKLSLVKQATSELYKNLSYTTLSGSCPLQFNAISDLIGELSFSIKSFTVQNQRNKEVQMQKIAKVLNDGGIFNPIVNDPLDDLETQPNPEHKKTTFPYVETMVQLPEEIENVRQQDDKDHTDLMDKIYRQQDFVTKTKKDKELGQVIEDNFQPTWDDYWWEDDVLDNTDTRPTIDQSKKILDDVKWETPTSTEPLHNVDINALATNILKNIRPVDNTTPQELIDNDFDYWADVDQNWIPGDIPSAHLSIPLDTRTWHQDDDNISLQSDNEAVTIEDLTELIINVSLPTTKKISVFKVPDPEPHIVTALPPVQPTPIPLAAPPKTMDVDIRALSDTILKGLKRPAPPPLLQLPETIEIYKI